MRLGAPFGSRAACVQRNDEIQGNGLMFGALLPRQADAAIFAAIMLAASPWIHVPGGSWNPTPREVSEVRAHLESFVAAQARSRGVHLRPWRTYTFQYQGQVRAFKLPTRVLSSRRVVFVNAFCTSVPAYAHVGFVSVNDGGACYFTAYYDTVRHTFIDVSFHGVA